MGTHPRVDAVSTPPHRREPIHSSKDSRTQRHIQGNSRRARAPRNRYVLPTGLHAESPYLNIGLLLREPKLLPHPALLRCPQLNPAAPIQAS